MNLIKQEAIRRMKKLNLMDQIIDEFKSTNMIYKSEFHGILSWLDEEEQKRVKDFETKHQEYNLMVYHVVKDHTDEGPALIYLYVTKDDLDDNFQNYFNDNLKSNIIYIYFDKWNTNYYSEHGTDYFVPMFGGLRIANVTSREEWEKLNKF